MEEIISELTRKAMEDPKFSPDIVFVGVSQLVKMMLDGEFVSEHLGEHAEVSDKKTRNLIFDQFIKGEMYCYTDFGKLKLVSVNLPSFLGFS